MAPKDLKALLYDCHSSERIRPTPNAPCMLDGKCSKKYPKSFAASTTVDEDGFPTLARPDKGDTFVVRVNGQDVVLDNRWIVPHTLYLLFNYRAHTNVEVCGQIVALTDIWKQIVLNTPVRAVIGILMTRSSSTRSRVT